MIQRCYDTNSDNFADYGGRGILVISRWHRFENFFEDLGVRPLSRTLDRIDNDLGYFPGNCRWSTAQEQARNRRSTAFYEFEGQSKPLVAWAETFAVPLYILQSRLGNGWPLDLAFRQPVRSFAPLSAEDKRQHRAACNAVRNAIRQGILFRPHACSLCPSVEDIQAHHHRGYAPEHWLDVLWVCRTCHNRVCVHV
jgi:hypothetical protein